MNIFEHLRQSRESAVRLTPGIGALSLCSATQEGRLHGLWVPEQSTQYRSKVLFRSKLLHSRVALWPHRNLCGRSWVLYKIGH